MENVQMQEQSASQVFTDEQPMLELELEQFDSMVLKKQAFDRLMLNPDFKLIILDDYLEEDFMRNAGLLKVMNNKGVVAAKDRIVEKIYAKGHLETWMKEIETTLKGIDNPEQRIEFVRQLEAIAQQQADEAELEASDA